MPLVGLYKLRRGFSHVAKNLRTHLDPKSHMSSFCSTELQRALKEQTFGIKSYSISSTSSQQATASVVLLEGSKITVLLTTQGFSVRSCSLHLPNLCANIMTGTGWFKCLRNRGRSAPVCEPIIRQKSTRTVVREAVQAFVSP